MRRKITETEIEWLKSGKDEKNRRRFGKYLIEDKVHELGGEHFQPMFSNGYGASIVRFDGSYGYPRLFELAVVKGKDWESCSLTYETSITDNVLGYLTEEEVGKILEKIEALSPIIVDIEESEVK